MISQSVVLQCLQGSEIWLEADSGDDCYVIAGNNDYRYNSFGGFALEQS